jgi:hypothetical protein
MRYADGQLERNVTTIMPLRRFIYRALAVLAACALLVTSRSALAVPSITIGTVTRQLDVGPTRSGTITALDISHSDCLQDDKLQFPLTITDPAGTQLEVWVGRGMGVDCTSVQSQQPVNGTCTQVFTGPPSPAIMTVNVRAQDIALVLTGKNFGASMQDLGVPATCDESTSGTAAQSVRIFFLLTSSGMTVASAVWDRTKIDLVAPPPPTDVVAGGASNYLVVNWSSSTDSDTTGYRVFCDPPPGGAPDAAISAPTVTDASSATCSEAGAGAADAEDAASDASDDSTTSSASDAGTCTNTNTDAGSSVPVICGDAGAHGAFFVQGAILSSEISDAFKCGDVSGINSNSANIQGFATNTTVAVAVASFDAVNNVGAISTVSCATTQPVNSFIDLYHQAGGTAGESLCSMPVRLGQSQGSKFLYAFVLFGALTVHRRRSRSRSN